MLPSVLSRPVRMAQHGALSALHVGLNATASVISAVRGGGNGDSPPVPAPNPTPPRTAPEPAATNVEPAPEGPTTTAKKGPATKKATAKKGPAKKTAAKKTASSAVPTPAAVAERVGRSADEPEHVEAEEALAYSTGPDVRSTVADEVEGSAKS
ncbi:MAG: hypothetical protein P1U38_16835 [Aeromicrobium sp.]|uniref:hypothetical protein n=1 Tax=Aeromicrobium sp. TaxID=1871063 RepID=UPI002639BFC6|nr:hypothetical protein [Aeromicrobium sp.]MDF1706432.1 hypothetical protein [Aeromicrobium sp.]